MADPEDLCFHTTYSLEADEVFGFEVEWAAHPSTWRRVVKITKIGRNCKFNKEEMRLKIDDIITDMNGREITSLDKFKRKVNERTTFRVLWCGFIDASYWLAKILATPKFLPKI